jgi:DNA/RNA-binding domain of Phe-tRNA-synthetase-like protein
MKLRFASHSKKGKTKVESRKRIPSSIDDVYNQFPSCPRFIHTINERRAPRLCIAMRQTITFSKSHAYLAQYPGVAFGLALISGCRNFHNPPGFDQHKRRLLRKMRKRETLAAITERIEIYNGFFEHFGQPCPLPQHLKRTIHSGFPRYNLMVDAHFMAEMCAGILVAVTDYDRFEGPLTLDVADGGEHCTGLGHRDMVTRQGEIVLRDDREIVCILCQGPDEKTRVTEDTGNVLYYAYAVPGIEAGYLEQGLSIAAEIASEFGGGTIEEIRVV